MDINLDELTLAALLTTAGATVLATIITGLVSIIGSLLKGRLVGNEARLAAFLAALFVGVLATQAVLTGAMVLGIPLGLAVVFAWYGVTRLSMSIYDDATNAPAGLRAQK